MKADYDGFVRTSEKRAARAFNRKIADKSEKNRSRNASRDETRLANLDLFPPAPLSTALGAGQ